MGDLKEDEVSPSNNPITSLVNVFYPHYKTWLKFVSFSTIVNYCSKVSVFVLAASVFSIQLTEKRSPKQLPISVPSTTSSGLQ